MASETRLTLRLGSVAALVWCLLARPAAAAETIVLLPLELSGGLEVSRADLEAAVQRGLSVAGRPVVESTAGGTYLVSGSITREGSTFRVAFRLVRSADRTTLNTQQNHCDVADCSLAELARRSARELVRQTLGRPTPETPAPRPAPASTPAPVNAPGPSSADAPASAPFRLWPAMGLGAGAASIGVGVYLIAIDGRCSSEPSSRATCRLLNDTRTGGIAAIAGGVVLGAVAAYFLVIDGKDGGPEVAVGVSPNGVVAAGRF